MLGFKASVSNKIFSKFDAAITLCTLDLSLPREVDPENPIEAHPSDCHVFFVYNYPMTCGEELVFNPGTLACEPAEAVADSRPECAS